MRVPVTCMLASIVLALLLTGCATTPPPPRAGSPTTDADAGYFLSWSQKGQLIGSGLIRDSQNRTYDIWIVPGYVVPSQRLAKYLGRTGDDFAEYVGREKYRDLADNSGHCFDWAYDDCLNHFVVRGVPHAWGDYMRAAGARTDKRVFGWWSAYPWAVMEGTVDTVVRIPLGLAGTALGTVAGVAIVPGFHAVDSTVEGTAEFGAGVVVGPFATYAWNTIIAPPMALVGQKPAPERVDGYWVTMKTPQEQVLDQQHHAPPRPATREEIVALTQWGTTLLQESRALDARRQEAQRERQALIQAAEARWRTNQDVIAREERARCGQAAAAPEMRGALEQLRQHGYDQERTAAAFADVERNLRACSVSASDIYRIRNLLRQYPPSAVTNPPPIAVREKTDPLQTSLQVIENMPQHTPKER